MDNAVSTLDKISSDVAKNADSAKMKNIESELAALRLDFGKLSTALISAFNLDGNQDKAAIGLGGKEYVS
jgi:hypothetical protein